MNSGFNVFSAIFWTLCLLVSFIQFYAVVCFGFVSWTTTNIYLRYKFREINDKFMFSLRSKPVSLTTIIVEHNAMCKLTEELNEFFKVLIFMLYYFGSPALMILMTLTHSENVITVAKFVSLFIFVIVFGVVFSINIDSSRLSGIVRRSVKYLLRYMADNQLTRGQRLKMMSYIETLNGPDIGFYCLDLFPMNSYEFYLYISNCMRTYFLILSLIPDPELK